MSFQSLLFTVSGKASRKETLRHIPHNMYTTTPDPSVLPGAAVGPGVAEGGGGGASAAAGGALMNPA